MESLESIYNLFPWSTRFQRRNVTDSGKIGTKSHESKLLCHIGICHIKWREERTQLCSILPVVNILIYIVQKISFRVILL